MIILTANPARVIRSFRRVLPPAKPTRIAPRPADDFAAGITTDKPGRCTPIDQRTLPTIEGAGLTTEEFRRVTGAENRARAAYAEGCPEASFAECHRVGVLAAKDELRRALKDRPAAPELKTVAKPAPRPAIKPTRRLAATAHTPADEQWWTAHAPSNRLGYYVEGGVDPYDTFANTMPATEYRELVMNACFGEPMDISGDANGQFGCVREGGDR